MPSQRLGSLICDAASRDRSLRIMLVWILFSLPHGEESTEKSASYLRLEASKYHPGFSETNVDARAWEIDDVDIRPSTAPNRYLTFRKYRDHTVPELEHRANQSKQRFRWACYRLRLPARTLSPPVHTRQLALYMTSRPALTGANCPLVELCSASGS